MIKKIFWTVLLGFSLFISACQDGLSQAEIEAILIKMSEELVIPLSTETDLSLPTSLTYDSYTADLSWTSANTNYISHSGVVTRPSFELGDQTVTLTVSLTYLDQSLTKTFDVTVIKLDEIIHTYTVTFNTNGGSNIEPIEVYDGASLASLPTPTKTGFTFLAWYKNEQLTELFNVSETILNHITLYARWIEDAIEETVIITFESNGGTNYDALVIPSGEAIDQLPTPIKENHTFDGWYLDDALSTPFQTGLQAYTNLTFYAKWILNMTPIYYEVSFETDHTDTIDAISVLENEFLLSLPILEKENHDFIGWYIDQAFTTLFDIETPITSSIILYANWVSNVPEGTPIFTAEAFNHLSNSGADGVYYLANDIDFSNHTWTYTTHNFKGTINGNGKTLSNLTIHGTDRTGLFSRVNNFKIFDVTLNNIHVTSTNRAGILFGEQDGNNVEVYNITIINSSVSGASSNGVGALIGYIKPGFSASIHHILIKDTFVTNSSSAAGGLIGMTDSGSIDISDIQLRNVLIHGAGRVGGIFGEIKGSSVVLNISRVFLDINLTTTTQYMGGIVGRNQSDTGIHTSDVFITGKMTSSYQNFGHTSGEKPISSLDNVYAVELLIEGTLTRDSLTGQAVISNIEDINLEWWETYLPAFVDHNDWMYLDRIFHLNQQTFIPENSFKVTLEVGNTLPTLIYVTENEPLGTLGTPFVYGYTFIGWFYDQSFEAPYIASQKVISDITLYAKFEALPSYDVTIDGMTQIVLENEFATKPQDPTMFGKVFIGWFVGETSFDFTAPITSDLVIESRFRDAVAYEISFGNITQNPVIIFENEVFDIDRLTSEGYRFIGWYLDEEFSVKFDQLYLTEDVTLYAKFALLGDQIFNEDFDVYPNSTLLKDTDWTEIKAGQALIENQKLKLIEGSSEAVYHIPVEQIGDGRYVLVYDFMQGIGGASFTIELLNGQTRIFSIGANRQNRFTYRNQDGSETAVPLTTLSVTPNVTYQAIILFDTTYHYYKYYVSLNDELIEITPVGGVSFIQNSIPNTLKLRTVGTTSLSSEPYVYLDNILIESSSDTADGKSAFDPEEPVDYEALIQSIYDSLSIPFQDDVRSHLILKTLISFVPIVWTSSHTDIITNEGIVTRDEQDDMHVSLTATISKGGYTLVKDFEVTVKALLGSVDFSQESYHINGFAQGHVSIPDLNEGDPGYYVVYNAKDLMDAINAENSTSKGTTAARVIEIRADLNLGFNEVVQAYGVLKNLDQHALPKMHPILKQTGVSKIVIQDRNNPTGKYGEGLVIFSEEGHTIKHAAFQIKRSNNIVIRNLKFDELWEWDEATKGDYDSNDWDYFTIEVVNGIWFDHIELGKAYDGLIDFKAGSDISQTVINATFSYFNLVFEPNDFIRAQFDYLEQNRSSYNYYNQMRNAGMTKEEIMELNSFQKKGFLLGGSSGRAGNVFTLTIYNSYIKNLQDRFPRLRGGDVHIFNSIYDATDVYEMRNYVRENYAALFAKSEYNRQLTNQALVTTEQGAILMENSIIKGVTQVIKSNQVNTGHPTMTGKYLVLDSLFILDDYMFFGSSEDPDTPFIRANSEPILPFSWSTISNLPYTGYQLVSVNQLESYLNQAYLGVTNEPFDWLNLHGKPILQS